MKKVLLLILTLSSCAPVYVPNIRNSPMLTSGGEFQASVSLGNGIEAQSALAITRNIGIMGNYSYGKSGGNDSEYYRHRLAEAGIGFFNNEEKMFFEFYMGYGKGEGSSYDRYTVFGSQKLQGTGKYERYFIQPGFGLNKKAVQVSFVPRVSFVDFYQFSDGSTTLTVDERPNVFWEPAVVARFNVMKNYLYFTFQGGFSLAVDRDPYFNHRSMQFSTGLGFRLRGAKEKNIEVENLGQ